METSLILPKIQSSALLQLCTLIVQLSNKKIREYRLHVADKKCLIFRIWFLKCKKFQDLASIKTKGKPGYELVIRSGQEPLMCLTNTRHAERHQDQEHINQFNFSLLLVDLCTQSLETPNLLNSQILNRDSQSRSKLQVLQAINKKTASVHQLNMCFQHIEVEDAGLSTMPSENTKLMNNRKRTFLVRDHMRNLLNLEFMGTPNTTKLLLRSDFWRILIVNNAFLKHL